MKKSVKQKTIDRLINLWKSRKKIEFNLIYDIRWLGNNSKLLLQIDEIKNLNIRISELEMLVDVSNIKEKFDNLEVSKVVGNFSDK